MDRKEYSKATCQTLIHRWMTGLRTKCTVDWTTKSFPGNMLQWRKYIFVLWEIQMSFLKVVLRLQSYWTFPLLKGQYFITGKIHSDQSSRCNLREGDFLNSALYSNIWKDLYTPLYKIMSGHILSWSWQNCCKMSTHLLGAECSEQTKICRIPRGRTTFMSGLRGGAMERGVGTNPFQQVYVIWSCLYFWFYSVLFTR